MTARTVCGCTPPNPAPVSRDPATVAQDLADAAERLDVIAYRMFVQGDDTGEREAAELDALAERIKSAAGELQMRRHGKDGAPCRD
jgi:hypothetical protein